MPGGYGVWNGDTLDIEQSFTDMYPKVPGVREYTECSSRGTCDYAEGVCNCFTGFEGKACRRATCPNDCSGHGRCLTNEEVDFMYTSHTPFNDQFWDKDLTQQCVCDRGYEGYDCSLRSCPVGDDPTTACSEHIADDYQLVFVQRSNLNSDEYFALEYEDNFGGEFSTRPIQADACTLDSSCPEVQYALLELPNLAIPNVEVRRTCRLPACRLPAWPACLFVCLFVVLVRSCAPSFVPSFASFASFVRACVRAFALSLVKFSAQPSAFCALCSLPSNLFFT